MTFSHFPSCALSHVFDQTSCSIYSSNNYSSFPLPTPTLNRHIPLINMHSPQSESLQPTSTRPKSPPLAFEPTSNDALAPLSSSSPVAHTSLEFSPQSRSMSGIMSPQAHSAGKVDMQMIIDQQTTALQLLHEAFAAERQVWSMEKEQMYQRIASLEQLLKMRDHYR